MTIEKYHVTMMYRLIVSGFKSTLSNLSGP